MQWAPGAPKANQPTGLGLGLGVPEVGPIYIQPCGGLGNTRVYICRSTAQVLENFSQQTLEVSTRLIKA